MLKIITNSESREALLILKRSDKITHFGIRRAFYDIGKDLKATTNKLILDGPKTGRVYLIRIDGRLKRHQASAPGEAPANLTDNLRKSIGYDVKGAEELEFGSRSGPPAAGVSPKQNVAKYSVYLESGTSKMEPRPYLAPSIRDNQRNTQNHFERQIKKGFSK